jgi:predicted esterase
VTLDPHRQQPVLHSGTPLTVARATVVLVHGRGATAESILALAPALRAEGVAFVAPQAAGNTWYPYSFLAPIERNEPFLSSALGALDAVVAHVRDAGIPDQRIVLGGFSQGACLASEYAARHARRWGGVLVLSGGLIGPPGTPRDYAGAFAGTPVFLGCSDVDAHIPTERVVESGEVFERLGATVTVRLYPGMPHTVNDDEVAACRAVIATALA